MSIINDYRLAKFVTEEHGFAGYIGYPRRAFFIKMYEFQHKMPTRIDVFNVFKHMNNLVVVVISYGDCHKSSNEIEILLRFSKTVEPFVIMEALNDFSLESKKEFIEVDNFASKLLFISRQDENLVYRGVTTDMFSKQYNKLNYFKHCFMSESSELDLNHRFLMEYDSSIDILKEAFRKYCEDNFPATK